MLSRVLSKAKKEGGKKVPINFQVPSELKEDFENLCKKNEVSITSMLAGLMETAIEEAQGIYFEMNPDTLMAIHNRIEELEKRKREQYYEIVDGYDGYVISQATLEVPSMQQALDDIDSELHRLYKLFNIYGVEK